MFFGNQRPQNDPPLMKICCFSGLIQWRTYHQNWVCWILTHMGTRWWWPWNHPTLSAGLKRHWLFLPCFVQLPLTNIRGRLLIFRDRESWYRGLFVNMKDAIGTLQETITDPTLGKGKSSTQTYLGMGYVGPQVGTFFHVVFPLISQLCWWTRVWGCFRRSSSGHMPFWIRPLTWQLKASAFRMATYSLIVDNGSKGQLAALDFQRSGKRLPICRRSNCVATFPKARSGSGSAEASVESRCEGPSEKLLLEWSGRGLMSTVYCGAPPGVRRCWRLQTKPRNRARCKWVKHVPAISCAEVNGCCAEGYFYPYWGLTQEAFDHACSHCFR